ncbi:hypothetical protein LSTR_LSTR008672 [Laodelphax striatellus]|uniref:EB domain-containing protein n=1 Tax=Laodelphax striatellus TaxID=195883 RepID=A0A482X4S1_LAOST|nr:hypothetical protein LSTR_LSTR008672 [Laodelphax striatellus]
MGGARNVTGVVGLLGAVGAVAGGGGRMRRRRGGGGGVAVGWPWLWLAVLMVAQGATTADPQAGDLSTSTTAEPTTTEEDMTGRGNKKFGDKCGETKECGFRGSVCDPYKHSCQCRPELTATNHIDKCGEEVSINGSCFFTEQCENKVPQTECKDGRCVCRFEMTPTYKDNKVECTSSYEPPKTERYVDPAMIGVLVGMALMFIIICVVLRLFSKARWRENRTIFNTPNPRLMNVSLLRDTKGGGGAGAALHERRGSRGSQRAPSRQPSMASLRPQSPNASQGSRASLRGSRSSQGSATSRSPTRAAGAAAHHNSSLKLQPSTQKSDPEVAQDLPREEPSA